ncbi:MAG: Uncharacterized protein CEO22_219, partial [Candidatus Berkelbacteria bacterium Gr01-1014_85]
MQHKHQTPYLLISLLLIFILGIGIALNHLGSPVSEPIEKAKAGLGSGRSIDQFELIIDNPAPGATTNYTIKMHTRELIYEGDYSSFSLLTVKPLDSEKASDDNIKFIGFKGSTLDLSAAPYLSVLFGPGERSFLLKNTTNIPANTDVVIKLNNVKNPTTPGVYYLFLGDHLVQSNPLVIGTPNVTGTTFYANGIANDYYIRLTNIATGTVYKALPHVGLSFGVSSRTGSGMFRFFNIPAGEYKIDVNGGPLITLGSVYGFFPGPKTLTVPASGSVNIDVPFVGYPPQNDLRPKEIKGKLVDQNGQPVAGVELAFNTVNIDYRLATYELTTNSAGEFTTSTVGGKDISISSSVMVNCSAARTQHLALRDNTIPVVSMFNEDSTYESKAVELRFATSCLPEWDTPFESTSAGQAYIAASASAAATTTATPSATTTATATPTSKSTTSSENDNKEIVAISKEKRSNSTVTATENEKLVKQSVDCIQSIVSRSRFNLISKGKTRPTVEEAIKAFKCFENGIVPVDLAPVDPGKIESVAKVSTESASIATPEVTHDSLTDTDAADTGTTASTTTKIKLSGRVVDKKNSEIFLYIFSDPKVYTVKTDNEGKWSYTLTDALEAGEHKVYLAYSKSKNNLVASEPIKFTVTKPEPVATPTISPTISPAESPALAAATSLNGNKGITQPSRRSNAFIQWLTNPFTLSSILVLVGVILFRLWR